MLRFYENPHRPRIVCIYLCIFAAMLGLTLRVGFLDTVRGQDMRQIEGRTLTSTIGILPNRGWIYDNHMRVLASNTPAVAIVVNRMEVSKDQLPRLAAALAPVMGVSKQALLAKMTALPGEKQVMVTDKANRAQVAFVSEHQSQLSGVHLLETWTRTYPYGSLAGHVLGYIQPQPADEADRYRAAGYLPSQKVGITGVEASTNTFWLEYQAQRSGRLPFTACQPKRSQRCRPSQGRASD